jgi:hypothetical protein
VCHIFGSSWNYVLKTIADTLNMSTKQKALQNDDEDLPSLKSGRPVKTYSIADAVKLVSFVEIQGVKVDMVEGILQLILIKFSLNFLFFQRTSCTANIFAGHAQQNPTWSGAPCLLPSRPCEHPNDPLPCDTAKKEAQGGRFCDKSTWRVDCW